MKLEQWSCTGNANQHWFFKSEGGGYYAVASAQNQNLVATIGAATDGSGNPEVELRPYTGAADQLWQLNELGIVYLHG